MDASTDHMDEIHDDVAEFAFLLTCLKERTDRSYAALARRLDMNASTLHRYCAGGTVPLDYAGIERFAGLCGASPEERVELHRRWILAVAARQRSRPSDALRTPTPHDTTGGTAPAVSTSDNTPADKPPEPTSPAARHPGPTSPAARHPGPTSPAARHPGPTSPAAPRPHAGRLLRRPARAIALAASFAVALVGLTASAAGPPAGGGPQENRASAGTVTVAPPAPLTWTANSHIWQSECAHDYVIAKPPRQVPPPPTPQDAAAWAVSQGAVHGRTTDLRISVQGRGAAAVVLEALHVRVVDRTVPAAPLGTAYSMYEGCGAILVPRHFSVDLDARRPLARSMPGNEQDRPTPAIDFPYQVSLREPEVLLLSARTESCTCDWYLELDWSSQGRTGTMRIDDHGHAFRTTSIKGLPLYWYRDPGGWVPMT
ncbi:helix-turn-helix domain-containing protein [Streptomyces sp. NPDC002680]|uniref:helix-turn-helix domain-containing protein n=1 Tax=Streptomyces sp. NPDC002680 TaxID=3364659 RepID=UPI0036B8B52C